MKHKINKQKTNKANFLNGTHKKLKIKYEHFLNQRNVHKKKIYPSIILHLQQSFPPTRCRVARASLICGRQTVLQQTPCTLNPQPTGSLISLAFPVRYGMRPYLEARGFCDMRMIKGKKNNKGDNNNNINNNKVTIIMIT